MTTQGVERRQPMGLPASLKAFLWSSGGATVLSLLVSFLRTRIYGSQFGSDGLWVAGYGFDFFDYYTRFLYRHSVEFFTVPGYPWYYPAPALFVHYPYYVVAHRTGNLELAYGLYAATVGVAAVALSVGLARRLCQAGLTLSQSVLFSSVTFLTSWAMYFAAQRGNVEGVTWLFVAAAIWAYATRRSRTAALLIGIAGSVKVYPFLFGALFLRRRRWRELGITAIAAVVTTVVSLRLLEPPLGDALQRVSKGVHQWTVDYGEVYRDPEWDHSLFGLVKDIGHEYIRSYHNALTVYYFVAGTIALIWYLGRIRNVPFTNQVLFLSCASIVLPPTSFDYTLCLLYVPFALLVLSAMRGATERRKTSGLVLTMVLLGLVLAPTTFLYSVYPPALPGACRAVCLVLLMIMASVLHTEEPSRRDMYTHEARF